MDFKRRVTSEIAVCVTGTGNLECQGVVVGVGDGREVHGALGGPILLKTLKERGVTNVNLSVGAAGKC